MLRPVSIARYGPRSRFHLPRAGSASAADRESFALTPDTQVPTSPAAVRINARKRVLKEPTRVAVSVASTLIRRPASLPPPAWEPRQSVTWLRLVGSPPDRRGSSG